MSGPINRMNELRRKLSSLKETREVLVAVAEHIGETFLVDYVALTLRTSKQHRAIWQSSAREDDGEVQNFFEINSEDIVFHGQSYVLPIVVRDSLKSPFEPKLIRALQKEKIFSLAVVGIYAEDKLQGWIECRHYRGYYRWRKEEILALQQIADFCALHLEKIEILSAYTLSSDTQRSTSDLLEKKLIEARSQYKRLVEYENILIVRTNRHFVVTDLFGNIEEMLGVTAAAITNDKNVWTRLLHPADLKKLGRKIRRMMVAPGELSEELRAFNQKSGQPRWFMLKGIPLFSASNEFLGWEGFALDITERRQAQEQLMLQSRRIEALYEVSRSLQINVDPALVTLRGLRALIRATNSDCGFGCFYDPKAGALEVVAAEGLSEAYVNAVPDVLNGNSLLRKAVESKRGFLFKNIQDDPRAAIGLAKEEGVRSCIVMPLMFEDLVLGGLVLFRKDENQYSAADFDLVVAAARQICLVARQAESYAGEKKQAASLAALYKLSHELSKHLTPKEVAEHAFPVIQEELACKRMWLGVINEHNTHIVGQAGFGPGIRRPIVNIQIELNLRHDFLDEAINHKQPVIVREGQRMECSGLNRVMERLKIGTFIIMPLVSLGQVIGVLVVEPLAASSFFAQSKLPLLNSMAGEIATVILARRFEAKMADADKMRMAGLLASGVAHNFNNLLQAVMGQASLIEMQLPKGSPLSNSAKMIVDSASRGASLISQLLACTVQESQSKSNIQIDTMLSESRDFYRSILGSEITVEVNVHGELPSIYADYSRIQQVISNLLVNAKEAVGTRTNGEVEISARKVRLNSGEIDPELAPGVYVRIDVKDNGTGMDADKQSRCFEPFFSTKVSEYGAGPNFGSSGLGLSSAMTVLKQHDGIITVKSAPEEGSVFSLYLPAITSHLGAVREPSAQLISEHRPDVLLIDLEDAVLVSVRSIVDSLGYHAFAAPRRGKALEVLRSYAGTMKLLMIDVDRSNSDALAFLRSVRREHATIPIVVSTFDHRQWSRALGEFSGIELVQKPLSVWALNSLMRKLLIGEVATPLAQQIEVERGPVASTESEPPTAQSGKSLRKDN